MIWKEWACPFIQQLRNLRKLSKKARKGGEIKEFKRQQEGYVYIA